MTLEADDLADRFYEYFVDICGLPSSQELQEELTEECRALAERSSLWHMAHALCLVAHAVCLMVWALWVVACAQRPMALCCMADEECRPLEERCGSWTVAKINDFFLERWNYKVF